LRRTPIQAGMPLACTAGDPEDFMRNQTRGFSLLEVLIVIVIVGILSVITLPKITSTSNANDVRASARELATSLEVARATAVQNGRLSQFRVVGDSIAVLKVNVDNSTTLISSRNLHAAHGVSLTIQSDAGDTLVRFDPRGMALPAVSRRYLVTKNGKSDTVCVFGAGKTSINTCGLAQ